MNFTNIILELAVIILLTLVYYNQIGEYPLILNNQPKNFGLLIPDIYFDFFLYYIKVITDSYEWKCIYIYVYECENMWKYAK